MDSQPILPKATPFHYLCLPRRIGPLVLTLLLSACASEPATPLLPDQAKDSAYDHQAVYNKPYTVNGKSYYPLLSAAGYRATGLASWYGAESGNLTANGSRFNPRGLSAAHKTLPLPSWVRVTNRKNGRYVDVVVNDRGPFIDGRSIDLSQGAAQKIGLRGVSEVSIEVLDTTTRTPRRERKSPPPQSDLISF